MNAREIKTVAVVGASGEMGRVFVSFCRAAGQEVRELGRPLTPQKLEAALAGADLVLLCVPIGAMRETLGAVAPHLTGGQILTDACSVKSVPLEQMLRAYAGPVVGTHPMFGGNLPEKSERRVAVTPGRIDAAAERVSAWLAGLGFAPFATTAREHDQSMALIQGLNFVTTVSYLSCTAQQPGIERFLTPSFKRRLIAAQKMLTLDAGLFEAIFEGNPASMEAVRKFSAHLSVAAGGDVNLLVERARWWWRGQGAGLPGAPNGTVNNSFDPRE